MSKTTLPSIPFNKPFVTGREHNYIQEVFRSLQFSGNNTFTNKCQHFFEEKFGFEHCFLTHSCSSALDIAATLCDFKEGDEVIIPSFAYVTSASAFHAKGGKLVFVDSEKSRPHISVEAIKKSITSNTKALVIIHYAGAACAMDEIMAIVKTYNLLLIEDCAQAINTTYKEGYLGSYGHMSTFSFHETKNIHCGEGGLLVINDTSLIDRTKKIWEEGTNRSDFKSGLVEKYEWVSLGSSYQPAEITAAFLYGQLQFLDNISNVRLEKWNYYYEKLKPLAQDKEIELPPASETGHNAHIFYLKLKNKETRNRLLAYLNAQNVNSVFHYQALHLSPYWLKTNEVQLLKHAQDWSDHILRLPLYYELTTLEQQRIITLISDFY